MISYFLQVLICRMWVYLRSDSYYMHIGNVVLHDGYIPTVGVDTLVNENFLSKHELMDIEAAVWFKVSSQFFFSDL